MNSLSLIQRVVVYALPLLFALTVREMLRARVATALGDTSPAQTGMLSWNPLKYVDPLGTIGLPLLTIILSTGASSGLLIGWPKLVPIDARRLSHPRRDLFLILLTGLFANLVMAILWAILFKFAAAAQADEGLWLGLAYMAQAGISLNISFLVLNLLPLPPYDLGRLLLYVLPPRQAMMLAQIEPYSFLILITLSILHVLGPLLSPLFYLFTLIVATVTGLGGAA